MSKDSGASALPDVAANSKSSIASELDWVGMSEIALPFEVDDSQLGTVNCKGHAQAFVNICRPDIKGIHMSRLYLLLEEYAASDVVSPASLASLLQDKLDTHQEISDNACVSFKFDFYTKRPALKSEYAGWKAYPVVITSAYRNGEQTTEVKLSIPYSSTCPCSASLARQLVEQALQQDFRDQASISKHELSRWLLSEKGSFATPHSQRSFAYIKFKLSGGESFPLSQMIDVVEQALQTPVQTAVKRADEQEFARLNGHNLMFCEDAARRVKHALAGQEQISDFWLKVEHQESLHAHDAVAIATKGVAGGYRPILDF